MLCDSLQVCGDGECTFLMNCWWFYWIRTPLIRVTEMPSVPLQASSNIKWSASLVPTTLFDRFVTNCYAWLWVSVVKLDAFYYTSGAIHCINIGGEKQKVLSLSLSLSHSLTHSLTHSLQCCLSSGMWWNHWMLTFKVRSFVRVTLLLQMNHEWWCRRNAWGRQCISLWCVQQEGLQLSQHWSPSGLWLIKIIPTNSVGLVEINDRLIPWSVPVSRRYPMYWYSNWNASSLILILCKRCVLFKS